ncbi:MAG: hypothetical protein OFPI_27230 [Osedax symbiont Rs2]|nr:MAG: hypothetical protein OFPI_27230 [Osedax symbiont Rs2]
MRITQYLFILATFFSGLSHAQTRLPAQVISAVETLNEGHDLQFIFENGVRQEGCSSSSIIVKDGAMSERILSIALSAYHASHAVIFIVSGCTDGAVKGQAVSLKKAN